MIAATATDVPPAALPWWKEPTKDQWFAWFAACFGWMLDAFDYTIFLFIMAPTRPRRDIGLGVLGYPVTRHGSGFAAEQDAQDYDPEVCAHSALEFIGEGVS